jgi:cytidylate kinase
MAVITISRQFASGGDEIAARICEILGYTYFDKQLMIKVAGEVGLSASEIVDFSEETHEVRSFLSRLFRAGPDHIARVVSYEHNETTGTDILTERKLDAVECIELVRSTVIAAYKHDNIVIVGRGGQAILQHKPHTLHIRITAPPMERIKYLQHKGMTGIADIKQRIAEQDRVTIDYLSRFHGITWDDPLLYHLVINTGKMEIETAAQTIAALVHQIEPTPA